MDEEDGRLGPRARQTGRVDVLPDALMMSLCSSVRSFRQTVNVSRLRHGLHLRTAIDLIQNEGML